LSTIDFSGEFGQHAESRLESDRIAWLTTSGMGGQPHPNPIWFLWHDGRVLMLSNPESARIQAIQRNPKVALSFNSAADGADIVVFNGTADANEKPLDPNAAAAFLVKYREGIEQLGSTPEKFAAEFSRVVTIELDKLRGYL
jgi:PPOX class probable F420-dependent enzyme